MPKNQLESLNEIFTQRLFRIPDFQRGYAWEPRKQLKDFWEDLVNLPSGRSHYTGMLAISLVPEKIWRTWTYEEWLITGKKYVPFYVVDGQQRLTTFVIFIQTLMNFIKKLPENVSIPDSEIGIGEYTLKEIVEKYIVENKRHDIIRTYKFGYEVDNPAYAFLKHRIFGEPNPADISETYYTANLENAKKFFDENIKEYFKTSKLPGLIQLFQKATQSMMFNIHEIDDDFDIYAAFETMNNRGKRLSNLELLKNRLIYLTTLFGPDQIDNNERIAVRNKINEAWKEVYYQLGRSKKHPLSDDEFLRAHWVLKYPFSNKRGDDYISFLLGKEFVTKNILKTTSAKMTNFAEIIEKTDSEIIFEESEIETDVSTKSKNLTPSYIIDYAESLKMVSKYWYLTNFPSESKEFSANEKLWLSRLNRLGIGHFRPLIVAAFLSPKSNENDRIILLKEIERFIFIAHRMCGAYSTFNQSSVSRNVRKVYCGEMNIVDVANEIRVRLESWVHPSENFNHNPFKDIMLRLKEYGGFYGWGALRYFLFEYENHLISTNGNAQKGIEYFVKSEKDKVSIEHIYPQTPKNSYWIERFEMFDDKQKTTLTSSLGNLLPLSMSINSSLQNDSFPDKKNNKMNGDSIIRRGYSDGSHSEVEVSKYEDWNAESILDRGLMLLRFMEKRWDIHFESKDSMVDVLGLKFVEEMRNNSI